MDLQGDGSESPDAGAGSARASVHPGNKADHSRIRRRNRMITSCLECRRRKLKCDKMHPCTNCSKFQRDCVFLAPALDTASQLKLTEIKEKMGSLERVLEQDVAHQRKARRKPKIPRNDTLPDDDESDGSDDLPIPEDEKTMKMEPTPLAIQDAAYEDDADDDLVDLGFKLGKMRVTERIGGFFRPKMAEELTMALDDWQQSHISPEERVAETVQPQRASLSPSDSFLKPGPDFIAPRAGFFFGIADQTASLIDYLPSRLAADRLLQQYQEAVHPISRVLHWPSLQVSYDNFWTNVTMGIEPAASLQALTFAILFSAAVSMPEEVCMNTFGIYNKNLVENFQVATEMALSKANFLRTTKVETLQAIAIYLIPMCRNEISRAHSALVSAAIRLAECMGLHRDPTSYGLSAIEVHVRRLLWYQFGLLDMRTCEVHGPRPHIRREEFDTELPLNINDSALLSHIEPKDPDQWTDMTFMRIRFECNEMHRMIWIDRVRLERKAITLTHVLGKIESFRKALDSRYSPMLDTAIPIHRLAKHVMQILTTRMHIMILHRYYQQMQSAIPERLLQILIEHCVLAMEAAVDLESDPALKQWAWYAGAFQQYHMAILLLIDMFAYPMRKQADRVWRCFDYIFETDPALTRAQKGRKIMEEMRDKFGIYRDLRKMRAPVTMVRSVDGASGPSRSNSTASPPSGRYSASTGQTPSATQSPQIPLNFNSVDWKPVQPVVQQSTPPGIGLAHEQSQSPPGPSSQRNSNWGFDSPNTFFVAKNTPTPKNESPAVTSWFPSYPPPQASATPSILDTIEGGQRLDPMNLSNFKQPTVPQLLEESVVSRPPATPQGVNPDMMVDIDWHEWDKIFPPDINTGELNSTTRPGYFNQE